MADNDTIFALSSAAGKAGVAVVRVSGPAAFSSLKTLLCTTESPKPRTALFKKIYHPENGTIIDEALVLPFKGPASFTGEDIVEYHLHGSPAVLDLFLEILGRLPHHRMADHGEFTRRAFENSKLNLTEAEAIADLINAETQAQREQAVLQMGGALSTLYEDWRTRLIKIMAYIEAVIDFPDEDIPDSEISKTTPALDELIAEISHHLDDNHRGERLRDGIHVAIIGAPNAGKSSLLNRLAKRDIAIVSPMAGTTRDVIEAHLDLGGYPVIVADTAGLRPDDITDDGGHGAIESEGIKRALERAKNSDLRILVFDGTEKNLDKHTLALLDKDSLVVFTKSDLLPSPAGRGRDPRIAREGQGCLEQAVFLSSVSGEGLDNFLAVLLERIKSLYGLSRETPTLTRARHRAALEDCLARLKDSKTAPLPELMAEDIRMGARSLGRITGRVDVEDLLDVIFRDFCIGK